MDARKSPPAACREDFVDSIIDELKYNHVVDRGTPLRRPIDEVRAAIRQQIDVLGDETYPPAVVAPPLWRIAKAAEELESAFAEAALEDHPPVAIHPASQWPLIPDIVVFRAQLRALHDVFQHFAPLHSRLKPERHNAAQLAQRLMLQFGNSPPTSVCLQRIAAALLCAGDDVNLKRACDAVMREWKDENREQTAQ
jgi:hypothetical protein